MTSLNDPKIEDVNQIDNAAMVTFENEGTTIYPAVLLYAAKGLADILWEKEQGLDEEQAEILDPTPS